MLEAMEEIQGSRLGATGMTGAARLVGQKGPSQSLSLSCVLNEALPR